MQKPLILIISFFLLMPVAILADSHEGLKTRIVIKADGDIDATALAELIEQAESGMDDEGVDVHVFVTTDEAIDMAEKHDHSMPHRGHRKMHMMMMKGGMHGEHRERMYQAGRHHAMNEGAAKCILKNIDRINNTAAAHLLMQACGALNKTEE